MSTATSERNKISELADLTEINNRIYAEKGLGHLISKLSGLCGINVFDGREAEMYYGLSDYKSFVLEKYNSLADAEKQKHKANLDEVLEEVDEELQFLERYL